jgi:hypothetical protein
MAEALHREGHRRFLVRLRGANSGGLDRHVEWDLDIEVGGEQPVGAQRPDVTKWLAQPEAQELASAFHTKQFVCRPRRAGSLQTYPAAGCVDGRLRAWPPSCRLWTVGRALERPPPDSPAQDGRGAHRESSRTTYGAPPGQIRDAAPVDPTLTCGTDRETPNRSCPQSQPYRRLGWPAAIVPRFGRGGGVQSANRRTDRVCTQPDCQDHDIGAMPSIPHGGRTLGCHRFYDVGAAGAAVRTDGLAEHHLDVEDCLSVGTQHPR